MRCPARRSSLPTELTSVTGWWAASSRAMRRQSSNVPSTSTIVAPYRTAWLSLASATWPLGTRTAAPMPALAAYAAADALVLPVEAHTTVPAPASAARLIATVIPRSLNEPVGLAPSTFSQTSQPVSSDRWAERSSGVLPSLSETDGVAAVTGSQRR